MGHMAGLKTRYFLLGERYLVRDQKDGLKLDILLFTELSSKETK